MAYVKDRSIVFPVRSEGRKWIENFDPTPAWLGINRVVTVLRTRSGVSLPKYQTIIQNGGNATTNMSATWDSVHSGKYDGEYNYKSTLYPTYIYRKQARGSFGLVAGIDTPSQEVAIKPTSFCWNLAAAAYNNKVRQEYQKMQGLVALGELRETLRMLRRPAQNLRNLSSDWLAFCKRRKKADPKGWARDIGGAWLEQAFGWKPLINDINDSVKGYKSLTNRITQPTIRRISAGQSYAYDMSSSLSTRWRPGGTVIVNNGPVYRNVSGSRSETHIVRFKGALRAQSQMPTWNDATTTFGLSASEFIPTAWELLPWSFLADYFTNIGDCLNSVFTNTSSVLYTNQTLITETAKHGTWVGDPVLSHPGQAHWYFASGSCPTVKVVMKQRKVTRSAGVGFPMPRLQVNFQLADGQLLNVAALLSQALALHPQNTKRVWHR